MCTKVGTVVKLSGNKLVFSKVRCRSWSCDDCAVFRRLKLIDEAKAGAPNRFITLTVNPNWFDSRNERAAKLAHAWRKIVALYRRTWPTREAEYLCVFEATKLGEPHLHIVWRGGWMPQKWLSHQMDKEIGAPIVDVRAVRGMKAVVQYVTKYITKENIRFGSCKRYWSSKGFAPEVETKADEPAPGPYYLWVTKRHLIDHMSACLAQGITINMTSPGRFECELPDAMHHPPWLWMDEAILVDKSEPLKAAA